MLIYSVNIFVITMEYKEKHGETGHRVCFLELPLLLIPGLMFKSLNHYELIFVSGKSPILFF